MIELYITVTFYQESLVERKHFMETPEIFLISEKGVIRISEKVLAWIRQHFDTTHIRVEDFPVFPGGKRIIDQVGQEMVVYWDILYGRVAYTLPDKR